MMNERITQSLSQKEHIYTVKGMHCSSCEVLIEKTLLDQKGIKSVEASVSQGKVRIEYEGERPTLKNLNKIFAKENYVFFDKPSEEKSKWDKKEFLETFGIALLLIIGFLGLNKLGLSSLTNVSSSSSLPTFFIFGLLAGISTCAALVGGIILSMSKQWLEIYSDKNSLLQKLQPNLLFNTGRIISYTFFGALLGILGNKLQPSLAFTSVLVIVVSIIMIFSALQMLGLKFFRKFQFTAPKSVTRYIAKESNFKGRYLPFLMGALTFFLPCGFTITAQGLALLSGNPLQGSLIMLFFALGTLPALLVIGLSSLRFYENHRLSSRFLKIAGFLVLFFAFFNINNRLNVLGFSSLSEIFAKRDTTVNNNSDNGFAPIIDGKQVLKMEASSSGYKPNYFKVKKGIPVRWEIKDTGTSGCTNAIISRSLFNEKISLTPGQTSIKEFTPQKAGKYKFSCWMGMVSGTIEVVDVSQKSSAPVLNTNLEAFLSLNQASPQIREAYEFALENPDNILDQVPCYCGCMQTSGHKNNRDCFLKEKPEGLSFDKMGLNCGLCVNIALTTKSLLKQGKSKEEISLAIDAQFKPRQQ